MDGLNLAEKLSTFSDHWQPRTIGQFNGHDLLVSRPRASSSGTSTTTPMTSFSCSRAD